jgi:hypothetical protein
VLVIWAWPKKGVRSVGKALEGLISSEPHGLDAVAVDLPEELAGQSLLHSLTSWTGVKLETTLLTARGWPVVEQLLGSRTARAVVALDPTAASTVDKWRGEGRLRAPVLGVTLGLRLDPAWARTGVDRLAVADERQAEAAAELGLPLECLIPCGIPVCGGFSSVPPDDKPPLRRAFDLPEDGRVVLVVTDGLEPDELTGALFQLSLIAERATIMFDVAGDDDAADLLRRRAGLYGVEARMFGKVEEAGQLWAAADVVVARPHIYVEQRAIALRQPYVHVLPADEPERETARIYVDRGIGRVVEHISTLAAEIDMQLELSTLKEARQRIGEISKRTAATDVARLIAQVTAQAEQILAEHRRPEPGPATPSAKPEQPEPAPSEGPLETIGAPAKDEREPTELLADIEAAEAEANRQVTEHQKQADLWNRRVALAQEKGADDLEREARRIAEKHMTAMHRALAELGRISERRKHLERKQATSRVERDFQRLEVEDALAALKKKLGKGPIP